MSKFLFVDGTNIVMRYAFAMMPDGIGGSRDTATAQDVHRVLAAVEKSIRECCAKALCTHAIIAVDSSVDPWRRALYPDYKKNRKVLTGTWSNRLSLFLSPRGWLVLRAPGEEADDVLATLVSRLTASDTPRPCAVLSGDSDLLQLSSLLCDVYQFGKKDEPRFMLRDRQYIVDKFGVGPEHIALYKALVGESGDDLPGVRGIGPKRATAILQTTTEPDAIRAVVSPEQFDLALKLVELNTRVELGPISPTTCHIPREAAHG